MDAPRDRKAACGFCEGSGLWAEQDGNLAGADPCPLCEGTGTAPSTTAAPRDDVPDGLPAVARLVAVLPRLTPAERQRLYEELHARYDCRIYRP